MPSAAMLSAALPCAGLVILLVITFLPFSEFAEFCGCQYVSITDCIVCLLTNPFCEIHVVNAFALAHLTKFVVKILFDKTRSQRKSVNSV